MDVDVTPSNTRASNRRSREASHPHTSRVTQTVDLALQTEPPSDRFAARECFVVSEGLQPPSPPKASTSDARNSLEPPELPDGFGFQGSAHFERGREGVVSRDALPQHTDDSEWGGRCCAVQEHACSDADQEEFLTVDIGQKHAPSRNVQTRAHFYASQQNSSRAIEHDDMKSYARQRDGAATLQVCSQDTWPCYAVQQHTTFTSPETQRHYSNPESKGSDLDNKHLLNSSLLQEAASSVHTVPYDDVQEHTNHTSSIQTYLQPGIVASVKREKIEDDDRYIMMKSYVRQQTVGFASDPGQVRTQNTCHSDHKYNVVNQEVDVTVTTGPLCSKTTGNSNPNQEDLGSDSAHFTALSLPEVNCTSSHTVVEAPGVGSDTDGEHVISASSPTDTGFHDEQEQPLSSVDRQRNEDSNMTVTGTVTDEQRTSPTVNCANMDSDAVHEDRNLGVTQDEFDGFSRDQEPGKCKRDKEHIRRKRDVKQVKHRPEKEQVRLNYNQKHVSRKRYQERVRSKAKEKHIRRIRDRQQVRHKRDGKRVKPDCDGQEGGPNSDPESVRRFSSDEDHDEHFNSGQGHGRSDSGQAHAGPGTSSDDRDRQSYVCKKCGASFTVAYRLAKHMTTHSTKEQVSCHICKASFRWPSLLTKHMRKHTGDEQRYQCNICGKKFSRTNHLNTHKLRHSGEKPYVCETCGCGFMTSSDLKKHKRTHTGEKPYRCEEEGCGASFARSDGLSKHQRRHAGVKRYICTQCNAKFVDSCDLDKHIRVHIRDIILQQKKKSYRREEGC